MIRPGVAIRDTVLGSRGPGPGNIGRGPRPGLIIECGTQSQNLRDSGPRPGLKSEKSGTRD